MTCGSLASNSEYFGHTRPWKSGPNLISSVRPFSKMAVFSVWQFPLEKRVVFIGMRVTLWKPGLFIINRAENKRLYLSIFFLLVLKTVGLLSIFFMIFEYFVFSTVYIQHLFSGVHPQTTHTVSTDWPKYRDTFSTFNSSFQKYHMVLPQASPHHLKTPWKATEIIPIHAI